MTLPESIRRAWRATDYRVRLAHGGFASIHCGTPLPAPLLALLAAPDAPWGYITAWNPAGVRLPLATNRQRQRALRDELHAAGHHCFAGIGVGTDDWREPSLFVPGIPYATLDALAHRHGQLGVVRGTGAGPAELREIT